MVSGARHEFKKSLLSLGKFQGINVTSQELGTKANKILDSKNLVIILGTKNRDLSDCLLSRDVNESVVQAFIENKFKGSWFYCEGNPFDTLVFVILLDFTYNITPRPLTAILGHELTLQMKATFQKRTWYNYHLRAKSSPPFLFVCTVLLECSHTYFSSYCLKLLSCYNGKVTFCDRIRVDKFW